MALWLCLVAAALTAALALDSALSSALQVGTHNLSSIGVGVSGAPAVLDKGYVLCGNNKHKYDILRMHYQLRHTWRSKLPIAIFHCDELYDDFIAQLQQLDPLILLMDLCPTNKPNAFNVNGRQAARRFRGFFCKVAAMIRSPFNDTIVLDSDTIWFSNPEKLFHSRTYLDSGSLFFRDRVFHYMENIGKIPYEELEELYASRVRRGYHVGAAEAQSLFEADGITLFWGNVANRSFPALNEHQDSSCIVVNKARHPKLLIQLEKWLFSFSMGYGDKEIFWISATMQQESFAWEPFLAAQYGDCFGLILHYDPDSSLTDEQLTPMYINAEYMVESETKAVGDFLRLEMTAPIFATEALTNATKAMKNFGAYDKPRDQTGCTCGTAYECVPVPHHANHYVLLSQWVLLSARLSRAGPDMDCVRYHVEHAEALNKIFHHIKRKDCHIIGCPQLPIEISEEMKQERGDIICDPVSFDVEPPQQLSVLARKARGFAETATVTTSAIS